MPIVSRVSNTPSTCPSCLLSRGFRPCGGSRASASRPPRCGAARSSAALGVPPGERRPVLLIPGFMAGDALARHDVAAGCGGPAIAPTAPASAPTSTARRRPAGGSRRGSSTWPSATASASIVIGQSRGGVFAKALAARRPDLVAGHRHARLADRLPARDPPARARPGRPRERARHRARARACSAAAACAASAARTSATRSRARSPTTSATSRSTRAATASSTGAPASTPRPTSSSRSAPRTAAWASTPRPSARSRDALAPLRAATIRCSRRRRGGLARAQASASRRRRSPRPSRRRVRRRSCRGRPRGGPGRARAARGRSRARSGGARSASAGSGKRGLGFAVVATPPRVE